MADFSNRPGRKSTIGEWLEFWLPIAALKAPSPATERARRQDVVLVADLLADELNIECGEISPLEVIRMDMISDELLFVRCFVALKRSHANASVARCLSTWRSFFKTVIRFDGLDRSPLEEIDITADATSTIRSLTNKDLETVVAYVMTSTESGRKNWPALDRALLMLLATGGLRRSEVTQLVNRQVHLGRNDDETSWVEVKGKGRKFRSVPLPQVTCDILAVYRAERDERFSPQGKEVPFFLDTTGKPFLDYQLAWRVKMWFKQAGVTPPPGAQAHSFRHSLATSLMGVGADINEVRQLLGHASLATTQRYTQASNAKLISAVESSPVARFASRRQG